MKKWGKLQVIEDGVSCVGPPLEAGPLPALIYLTLSDHVSLMQAPYNTPVACLDGQPLRVFSLTLPAHQPPCKPEEAFASWAAEMRAGKDPLTPFIERGVKTLERLQANYIDNEKVALAGLSRGAFFALHFAARTRISTVLGLAPLTTLQTSKDFADLTTHPVVESLSLLHHLDALSHKKIRLYIGNRDFRVSTDHCFSFIRTLTDHAHAKRIRSLPFELIISPSIGYLGHGTSDTIFHQGTAWIRTFLT